MNRRSLLLSGGAAVVAAGAYAGLNSLTGGHAPSLSQTLLPNAAHAQTGDGAVDTSRVMDLVLGDPDAEVTIIEFASYTCPHCANFHANVWPTLKAEYIDTGKVRFEYREVYFDAYGLWAALVARCGGEMRYFGISDMLYDEQSQWARGADGNAVADNLRRIGRRAGMSDDELNQCLTDRELATAMMQVYQEGMTEYGIQGTPSFVINGTTYSNMSMDEFRAILDPLLN
ncbi:DsbA family protein [Pararhodobacter sp.]|uniref:DsbA family protein n=1 Tax=Pararhodobacter sp. TaxID=2127056 RepID=UPI002FE1FD19